MTEAFQEAEEPKVENLDDEEIEIELVEPVGVTRTSPYAIASFAVALLAAYGVPNVLSNIAFSAGLPGSSEGTVALRVLVPGIASIAFAVVAFWLASKAEDEIFVDGHGLGGVGLYRAARVLAIVAMAILAVGVAVSVVSYVASRGP